MTDQTSTKVSEDMSAMVERALNAFHAELQKRLTYDAINQASVDVLIGGTGFIRILSDGTVERIDPTRVSVSADDSPDDA